MLRSPIRFETAHAAGAANGAESKRGVHVKVDFSTSFAEHTVESLDSTFPDHLAGIRPSSPGTVQTVESFRG